MSNLIAITDVKPGMVIVRITQQNGPVKIRKSGLVSSEAMIQGLSEMGVQEVEIDPAQTVEIAPESSTQLRAKTQTQALLRGDHDTSAKFDHALSDQFNRSLFLPTVQGLPSLWKVYTRQVLTFAVLILGGVGIGFTAATHSLWWPTVASRFAPDQEPTPVQQMAKESGGASKSVAQQNTTNETSESGNIADDQGAAGPQGDTAQTTAPGEDTAAETQSASNTTQPAINTDTTPPQSTAEDQNRSEPLSTQSQTEEEGTVLNERPDNENVSVSPELMARFNAAVEAMDEQATDPQPEPRTKVSVRNDLPRVDQLPVRLLTRLPTMNFSAHMYASRSRDRWVRVNGMQLGEGDWIDDKVQIVNIEAQQVVLAFEDELFTMAALTDW